MRRRRGRGPQALPSPRRHVGLRRAGADGAAVEHALPAGRRPGQLRLDRRRSARRLPLHRMPADAIGRALARRYRQGDGRLRPQLRRLAGRAGYPAVVAAQPADQRLGRDRGRDGDQYPAAQSQRGLRRAARADQGSRAFVREDPRHHSGAGLSHRRPVAGPHHDSPGLPQQARDSHDARAGRDRDRQALRQGLDNRSRDSLPGQQDPADRADRGAGQRKAHRRGIATCATSPTATGCGS